MLLFAMILVVSTLPVSTYSVRPVLRHMQNVHFTALRMHRVDDHWMVARRDRLGRVPTDTKLEGDWISIRRDKDLK